MTEQDEEATYRAVRTSLDLFAATIEAYQGEVMNYAGDAILARFYSAEDALVCAARVNSELNKLNDDVPEDRKIRFRIGLNLGDIIEDRGDIFGDGVNVAARLEGLGKPEGICVSGSFYDAVVMKLPFDFEFMGEQQVKNIKKPIRAYHATVAENAELPQARVNIKLADIEAPTNNEFKKYIPAAITGIAIIAAVVIGLSYFPANNNSAETKSNEVATVLSDQPSIIVLPFNDISEKKDQEYFVDGMTEDIITDLSRLAHLKVMARNTSFRYKDQVVKPQQIASELKVHYMLEGSVRKSGDRIRINAQLIDTRNGYHLWADRYDRKLTELFTVQDEVTNNIVKALSVELSPKEKQDIAQAQTNNIDAYEAYLRAWRLYTQRTKESNIAAQDEFKHAIKLDPTYARSYGSLALANIVSVTQGWADSPATTRNRALDLAKKSIELDPNLPQSYWALGFVHVFRSEYIEARKAVEAAIKLAPSYADGYGLLALINNRLGDGKEAIRLIKKGMTLNPYYTWDYPYNHGRGLYSLGKYKEAVEQLKLALSRNENAIQPRLFLAASYAGMNLPEDGEWEIDQAMAVNPDLSISHIKKTMTIANKKQMAIFIDHLRKAKMPE